MQLKVNINRPQVKETRNIESSRSRRPPWPGINVPESLTPEFRFIRLSTKSPITPAIPQSNPKTMHCQTSIFTPGNIKSRSQIAVEQIKAGTKPSHVFFGEIWGAILCLPKALPNRYAKPSFTETVVSKKIMKIPPHISLPGIAIRSASKHVSKNPVYIAPKKLMQTSAILAWRQKTYHISRAIINAAVTKITPFIWKKK